ncbi:MAG: T9SS type A sorting domain-containing protein [Rhodothermales bacterium]
MSPRASAPRFLSMLILLMAVLPAQAQDGQLDLTFDPGTATGTAVESVTLQPDGKIIVTGHFDSRIVRLHADGSVDSGFTRPGLWGAVLYATAVLPDGKVLVVGQFSTYLDVPVNNIVRLNADGTVDNSFHYGDGPDDYITNVIVQPDGKILISGRFKTYDGVSRAGVARLNADGTVDPSFDPGTGVAGVTGDVQAMALHDDGRIVLAGLFTSYNGVSRYRIAQINADGSLDTSFEPARIGGGAGSIHTANSLATTPDGKVVVGGHFSTVDATPHNSIVRLNADGSVDTSFTTGAGVHTNYGTAVNALLVMANGKVLLGGAFNTVAGEDRRGIARLNADGSLDASFTPGTGLEYGIGQYANVASFAMQPDGNVLVGGFFVRYNDIERRFVLRLTVGLAVSVEEMPSRVAAWSTWPNPARDALYMDAVEPGSEITVHDLLGRTVRVATEVHGQGPLRIPVDGLSSGTYLVRVRSGQAVSSRPIMIMR